jgi:hypothetical protein
LLISPMLRDRLSGRLVSRQTGAISTPYACETPARCGLYSYSHAILPLKIRWPSRKPKPPCRSRRREPECPRHCRRAPDRWVRGS